MTGTTAPRHEMRMVRPAPAAPGWEEPATRDATVASPTRHPIRSRTGRDREPAAIGGLERRRAGALHRPRRPLRPPARALRRRAVRPGPTRSSPRGRRRLRVRRHDAHCCSPRPPRGWVRICPDRRWRSQPAGPAPPRSTVPSSWSRMPRRTPSRRVPSTWSSASSASWSWMTRVGVREPPACARARRSGRLRLVAGPRGQRVGPGRRPRRGAGVELPVLGGQAGGPGMFPLKDPVETAALLVGGRVLP